MRNIYLLISAGFALAASGVAPAQTPAPTSPAPGRTALGTLDTDRDGSISRTEATMNPSLSAHTPPEMNGTPPPGDSTPPQAESTPRAGGSGEDD